jgi:hypothetical protein
MPASIEARITEVPSGTSMVLPVDGQPDGLFRFRGRGAVVDFLDQGHRHSLRSLGYLGRTKILGKWVSALITG